VNKSHIAKQLNAALRTVWLLVALMPGPEAEAYARLSPFAFLAGAWLGRRLNRSAGVRRPAGASAALPRVPMTSTRAAPDVILIAMTPAQL